MEIVEHLQNIGFVLFHHRNDTDQHLFRIKNDCKVITAEEVEADCYKNVSTTGMYLSIDFDTTKELDSSSVQCSKKACKKTTRYDAQYATIESLL